MGETMGAASGNFPQDLGVRRPSDQKSPIIKTRDRIGAHSQSHPGYVVIPGG